MKRSPAPVRSVLAVRSIIAAGSLLVLAACGGSTLPSTEAERAEPRDDVVEASEPAATVPADPATAAAPESPTADLDEPRAPGESLGVAPEETGALRADAGAPVDPEPLVVGESTSPGDAVPFEPVVHPFESVPMPQPALPPIPAPSFAPVTLFDDDAPAGSGDDGLVLTAATGCADHCITDATISTAGGTSSRYHLRVDLESPARVEAYLSLASIERTADGRYVKPFSTPTAAQAAGFGWNTTFDLEASTDYHLLVRAIDDQGTSEVAGSFTTAAAMGPGALMTPMPCADGCVEWVATDVADDGTALTLGFEADADTTVELAWSTEPFDHDAEGRPTLADPLVETHSVSAGSAFTLSLSGLTPNSVHHVLVTATDAVGGTHRMAGAIATPSPIIHAGIDYVHVRGDGDDGRFDRGEIHFEYGIHGSGRSERWDTIGEDEIASDTRVWIDRLGGSIRADGTGRYPEIAMYAGERDGWQRFQCFEEADEDWRPDGVETCRRVTWTYSSATVPQMTLAEIEALPACDPPWNVRNPAADRCIAVGTPPNGSDQVSFDMVVWFDLG